MRKLSTMLVTAMASSMAMTISAQVTTSSMSGKVTDDMKEAVIGATVTAVHVPSGTLYGAITNVDGRYTIQGMRTGGPYKVEVSFVGFKTVTYENVYLELGNTFTADAQLVPSAELLGEVMVVAEAVNKGGAAGGNFSTKKIQNSPTISRNVYDVVKNMPMAMTNKSGGISIAGTNNRYNSFQIDGTASNDVFGLSASGTNGGQTGSTPVSMDAIQEIQVVIAPYDVRQSGFTGGGINAITKQGTNKMFGSAYAYYTNEDLYGKYNAGKDGYPKEKLAKETTKTFGATLGGAFIPNKLFYFVSAEKRIKEYPSTIFPGYNGDKYLTEAMANDIVGAYKRYTGIQEYYTPANNNTESLSLMARIDWNINKDHKFAIRYQHNNSFDDKWSISNRSYTFLNSGHQQRNNTHSLVAELNSRMGDKFYNELRVSGTFVRDKRVTPYQAANVFINNKVNDTNGTSVNIGTEYSSGANTLDQDVYVIEDNLSYYAGKHSLTFGMHHEYYLMKNLFIQSAFGAWDFDSLADFVNDKPSRFRYKFTDPAITGGDLRYAPSMRFGQFGFYVQDKWDINNLFNLTYGLRLDMPESFNNPMTNEQFNAYAREKGFGVAVGQMPKMQFMLSPRLGFRWYTNENRNTLIRGGVGLFTGRVPFVWLSNAYNNTGMEIKGTTVTKNVPGMTEYAKDPLAYIQKAGAGNKPDIVTIDRNFKFPQVLRANLAVEKRLPGNMKVTLEGVYSKTLNNVFFENLALTRSGNIEFVPGVAASAVPYYSIEKSDYYSIINLRNTNKGYSYVLSALIEKSFDFGLDLSASYTHSRSKSINDGTSSVALSNWQYNYSKDSNSDSELSYSRFDMPHRIMLQASYTTPKYFKGLMQSTISVVYVGSPGGRYSLTLTNAGDFNGDGSRGNTLLYIPTKDELAKMNFADTKDKKTGKVLATAEENRQRFGEWIENDSYARNHRGQYAERNGSMAPWEHRIDLHFAQDIFWLKSRGSKVQLTFDIENFANMLNKKWGAAYGNIWNIAPLAVNEVKKVNGTPTPSFIYNSGNQINKADIGSRWHAQVGLKVIF
ncbi:MAG: carboxypeptidase regulatory-like domain-containing protein [Phocaeicola sp.]|nr:carboxypeptidase regulatory-like domain-containing protein [Phocaeicola sp.]